MSDAPVDQANSRAREESALKRSRMAQWGSLLALTVSALALAVGSYQTLLMQRQTRLMQVQARASVWPRIDIGYAYAGSGSNTGFQLRLENNGVGPAIVHWVRVTMDGKAIHHWTEVLSAVMGSGTAHAEFTGVRNIVIPPSTNRDTVVTALSVQDADIAKKIYDVRDRLDMKVCYCSVYDDCWTASWKKPQPRPTTVCGTSSDDFDY
ncbi:MAG: hypothetical protein WB784_00245 [Rhodanobacteraceae bacterium]